LLGPIPDVLGGSDVFEGDLLVVVHKKDRTIRGLDDFFDLVFALVAVKPGFFVEAMGFVHHQHVHLARRGLYVGSRSFEQGLYAGWGQGSGEFGLEDLAGRGVFGDVMHHFLAAGQFHKQVDGHHRFAGPRSALHDHDLLAFGFGLLGQVKGSFVNQFLFVQQNKFPVPAQHVAEGIGQLAGWSDPALVNAVHDLAFVPVAHKAFDKIPELQHLGFEKNRGFVQVFPVKGMADHIVHRVVVEVSARVEADAFIAHGFAEVVQHGGVGPSLVRRVAGFMQTLPKDGADNPALDGELGFGPLLEFHDDDLGVLGFVGPRKDKVNALAGLRDLAFDRNPGIPRDLVVVQDPGHVVQGIPPGLDFPMGGAVFEFGFEILKDDGIDVPPVHIVGKAVFGGTVNNHRSVYLRAFPAALSTGYLRAFWAILSKTICRTSRLQRSANNKA